MMMSDFCSGSGRLGSLTFESALNPAYEVLAIYLQEPRVICLSLCCKINTGCLVAFRFLNDPLEIHESLSFLESPVEQKYFVGL